MTDLKSIIMIRYVLVCRIIMIVLYHFIKKNENGGSLDMFIIVSIVNIFMRILFLVFLIFVILFFRIISIVIRRVREYLAM